MSAPGFPWKVFWLLLVGGILGVGAVIPYLFSPLGNVLPPLPIPWPLIVVLQLLQSAVLLALAIGFGLLIARKLGLGAPLLESWLYATTTIARPGDTFGKPLLVGTMLGVLITLLGRFIFRPHLPQLAAISALFPRLRAARLCAGVVSFT